MGNHVGELPKNPQTSCLAIGSYKNPSLEGGGEAARAVSVPADWASLARSLSESAVPFKGKYFYVLWRSSSGESGSSASSTESITPMTAMSIGENGLPTEVIADQPS